MAESPQPLPPIVASPGSSLLFSVPGGVTLAEPLGVSPGITYPQGILAGGVTAGLKQSGRPDVGAVCIAPDYRAAAASAAVFTSNAFAAAPVVVCRNETDLGGLLALVVNSGNANACTGEQGMVAARAMQSSCARALELSERSVAVASTGIIGVQLDKDMVTAAANTAAAAVHPAGGPEFSQSIMTTDRFAKACAVEVVLPAGSVKIGACVKGAGMISPAMATMICVVTTDALLDQNQASELLRGAVDASFNRISVDGEMSTNDAVFFMASGASAVEVGGADATLFADALEAVLLRLALMMVADGEGATKIMRIVTKGAESQEQARRVCRGIANSPLVKTAMHGGDPNWGRIVSSAGAILAGFSLPEASLRLCGIKVFERGAAASPTTEEHRLLADGMKQPEIDIELNLGLGGSEDRMFFSDLGHEYITINAEYHT